MCVCCEKEREDETFGDERHADLPVHPERRQVEQGVPVLGTTRQRVSVPTSDLPVPDMFNVYLVGVVDSEPFEHQHLQADVPGNGGARVSGSWILCVIVASTYSYRSFSVFSSSPRSTHSAGVTCVARPIATNTPSSQ